VSEAASITANEALEINVVDIIAGDLETLLEEVDGWLVETAEGEKVRLRTAGAELERYEMDWRTRFLNTIANPNLAYILLLLGFYGLLFELYNPGAVIPGVIGVISLIVAFFAMQTLPLNWAGLLLIVAGILMFILEIKVTSYGFLTFGGAVSLALGSVMLFDTAIPALRVSMSVIIPTILVTVGFFAFALTWGIRAQKNKVATGSEGMVGEVGTVYEELNPEGRVRIGGEYWKAEAADPPIEAGARIEVVEHSRMLLKVRRRS
jgi:membrane-bound serine protease (ClpP class)